MITSPQEYDKLLYKIQDYNAPTEVTLIPNDERVFNVDLNTRTIEAPEFLSVEHEHHAETIYFICDRFYDSMDLANTTCIIQYINANNQGYVYAVPFLDITTNPNKIIIPWCIAGPATAYEGDVEFMISFYTIDRDSIDEALVYDEFVGEYTIADESMLKYFYKLSTLPATSKVLHGMSEEQLNAEYELAASVVNMLLQRVEEVRKNSKLYWIDADELFPS